MRRGHQGVGGWRGENPRHFRPRGGGPPHFRPPGNFRPGDQPRFPGPRPPLLGLRPFNPPAQNEHISPDKDRNNFRHQRPPPFEQRQIFPLLQQMRHGHGQPQMDHGNQYHDNQSNQYHINNMGDIDQRHNVPHNRDFNQRPEVWTNPPFFDNGQNKPYRQYENEQNKPAVAEYTGHRPPASDHYGASSVPDIDNSNTFSRSVDDTVNIVRKRLERRGSHPHEHEHEPVHLAEGPANCESTAPSSYPNVQPETSVKKRIGRTRNVKANCDKIKTKIVNQLFKMDKDKIHKLMDNPNSSSKFEYAISSLVTESQNSYNRHLRSQAEKSLCNSSEIIHHDNDTIYEDTFMRQMQCILDPQDTIMLEDIKPMVLDELYKVLQLEDFEQVQEHDEQTLYSRTREKPSFSEFPPMDYAYGSEPNPRVDSNPYYDKTHDTDMYRNYDEPDVNTHLFERRRRRHTTDRRTVSPDRHRRERVRRSIDRKASEDKYSRTASPSSGYRQIGTPKQNDYYNRCPTPARSSEFRSGTPIPKEFNRCGTPLVSTEPIRSGTPSPLFDPNVQFSDDDDQFAELDKQYHVAVDHNFIDNDNFDTLPTSPLPTITTSPQIKKENLTNENTPRKTEPLLIKTPDLTTSKLQETFQIKKEIDLQLQTIAKSPVQFSNHHENNPKKSKEDSKRSSNSSSDTSASQQKSVNKEHNKLPHEESNHEKSREKISEKSSLSSSSSRKRPSEEKPSHRKEKRKKSETEPRSESNKQILNKNIIINVNDCATKSEKCDTPKSIFNLFFAKDEKKSSNSTAKENKKLDSSDKTHPDKSSKRKEDKRKSNDKESDKKKHDSTMLSPTDTNPSSGTSQTPTKGDSKLKSFDMFMDLQKKSKAYKISPAVTKDEVEVIKPYVGSISKKVTKRHVSTQVIKKALSKETQTAESKCSTSRFSQTVRKRLITRGTITEPVSFKATSQVTDPLERMKEIDMEIQGLLQEKFKLYSSMENKDAIPTNSTMGSLGMAVLNVPAPLEDKPDDSNAEPDEDSIVDDFANIPVEELEQIAFETVQESAQNEKRSKRQKTTGRERKTSEGPPTSCSAKRKRSVKPPNISLIEQIITDDRPLEDIISLDDLESPVKTSKKKNSKSQKPKKKSTKKAKTETSTIKVDYEIKPCSVSLVREDLERKLKKIQQSARQNQASKSNNNEVNVSKSNLKEINSSETDINEVTESNENKDASKMDDVGKSFELETVIEEAVVNDIQFDMLDVSEDIVIGDSSEMKSSEKDGQNTSGGSTTEDIILDNSQHAAEDTVTEALTKSRECKIFDYSSDENLRRDSIPLSMNVDSVLAVESIENGFVAGCLDGNVYHFNADGQLLNTLRGSNLPVTCLTIVVEKYGTTVYTGSLDSRIRYFDLETGLEKGPECNVLSPIQTMDRAWDTVFVGTRTGFVLQFECKNNMLIPVSTVKFSEQSILALRAMKEGPRKVLLVAARAETVSIRDAQTGLLLRSFEGPKMTVYTLLFEDGKIYCGTSCHQIHVFDYASGSHVGAHEGGKGAVCLRATGGLVFAGCYDGCVYVFREGDARPLAQLRGPSLMLLSLAVVGNKIVAGYKDRSLFIWKLPSVVLDEMIL